jgi:hypothetical protein
VTTALFLEYEEVLNRAGAATGMAKEDLLGFLAAFGERWSIVFALTPAPAGGPVTKAFNALILNKKFVCVTGLEPAARTSRT